MNTIQTCQHAIAMLEDEQSMTGWSDAHTAALRLAVRFLAYGATGPDAEDSRDAARYRWLRDVASRVEWLSSVQLAGGTPDGNARQIFNGCKLNGRQMDADIDARIAQLNKETQG